MARTLYFDIETTGLDPWRDRIITVQHSLDGGPVAVDDCRRGIPQEIRRMLADPSLLKAAHNVAYDAMFLAVGAGIWVANLWDTMLAERVLTMGLRSSADLATLANKYSSGMPVKEAGRTFKDISYGELPDWALDYARRDVEVLPDIMAAQKRQLEVDGLARIAQLEFDLIPVIVRMQAAGVRMDEKMWNRILDELGGRKQVLELELDRLAGVDTVQPTLFGERPASCINWQSQPQTLDALKRGGVDVESTAEKVLLKHLGTNPNCDIVNKLLEHRGITGLYRFDLPKHINPKTGRIHPHYNQLGARSGRTSCSDPNLQNIPNPKNPLQRNLGVDFRKCIIPSEGKIFVGADYSQIELRILAEMSGERRMLDAFRDGRDLHLETARLAYGEPDMPKSDRRRQWAKNANFCRVYGGGAETLSGLLRVSMEEGKAIMRRMRTAFPGTERWEEEAKASVSRMGFAETAWGRRRYFTPPGSEVERAFLDRVAINTPVQGTAADIAKLALVRLGAALPDADIILFVHDEIVVEADASKAEETAAIVVREMEAAGQNILTLVPIKVDTFIRDNWGGMGND